MAARITAWIVWALLAVSVVAWGTRLFVQPVAVPVQAQLVGVDEQTRGDALRLFAQTPATAGSAASASPNAGRFKLVGVASASPEDTDFGGVALVSVDGRPARAFELGAVIEGEWVVQIIEPRQVRLGRAGELPSVTLDLPALPPPATGTLSMALAAREATARQLSAVRPGASGILPAGMAPGQPSVVAAR
jgi:general secretion pathway protein C